MPDVSDELVPGTVGTSELDDVSPGTVGTNEPAGVLISKAAIVYKPSFRSFQVQEERLELHND